MQLNADVLTCHNTLRFAVTHPKAKVWALIWGSCAHVSREHSPSVGSPSFWPSAVSIPFAFKPSLKNCPVGCDAIKESSKTQRPCFWDNLQLLKNVESFFLYQVYEDWGELLKRLSNMKEDLKCHRCPPSLRRKDRKMVQKHQFWPDRVRVSWIIGVRCRLWNFTFALCLTCNRLTGSFTKQVIECHQQNLPSTLPEALDTEWAERGSLIYVDVCQNSKVAGGRELF